MTKTWETEFSLATSLHPNNEMKLNRLIFLFRFFFWFVSFKNKKQLHSNEMRGVKSVHMHIHMRTPLSRWGKWGMDGGVVGEG